jgi:UDPglucose 6-dehydrogenase
MRMSVIGCGYLGAVHAAAMASLGHDVVGVDTDPAKIERLSAGEAPFFEPGLEELLSAGVASGQLRFTTDVAQVAQASLHFIAVGTPQRDGADAADVRFVDAAIDGLVPHLKPGDVVAGKSTVPVGTAARLAPQIEAAGATLVWNPEFLREGWAVQDTIEPDRIVVGVSSGSEAAVDVMRDVYASALSRGCPLIVTDWPTAELVKVAANAFLATKISFINAMAEIAEVVGADVTQLADALGQDDRIGRRFLGAGIGFGGGCLPKDIRAFAARAEELGRRDSVGFLREVDAINLRRRQRAVDLVVEALDGDVVGKKVAVLGAAFKPHSDDVRDSPALAVAVALRGLGAEVVVTDPAAVENARRLHPQLSYASSVQEALQGASATVLVTEWDEYRRLLSPVEAGALVQRRVIVDGRNCLDAQAWRDAGWEYRGMGKR